MSELAEVVALIRGAVPAARAAHFMTSDQHTYGFELSRLCDADGCELAVPDAVLDEVHEAVCDFDWDGVMRENARGYSVVDLVSGVAAPDGV